MIAYRYIATLGFLFALAMSESAFSQPTAASGIVRVYDQKDFQGQISLQWSSDVSATFSFKGSDKWMVSQPLSIPKELGKVRIEGSVTWSDPQDGVQKSTGASQPIMIDFTPALKPLRSEGSWGKRMAAFVAELRKLEERYAEPDEGPSQEIKANGPVPLAQIQSAERRLNFALPDEHKQLLQDYGAWSYSWSKCVASDDIDRVEKQMRSVWGSPASEFDTLSAATKSLYDASVMLFVEGGDGYGALIYHPTDSGGEYYWTHQETLDDPVKLVDSQGKLRDYSSAMRWVIANQILESYEDAFPEHVFIDRGAPIPLMYQMRLGFPQRKKLEAALNVEWKQFE